MAGPLPRLAAALSDRYRIERELGQGGMATVYLAQDHKHDRRVAIKVLKPELAAVLGAERFVVEIKTTAALQHPHILPLFDSGSADGFLYYVMPYIEGETLRSKLDREKQLGIDEAVRIATEVADALDYAHRHGVIHRDIKPENILLHDGRPMVADFGIALAVSAAAGGRMTETGLSLGTPYYMSPEQATADRDITARSDVYSLASVLYEMLAGEPPHMGNSAQQIIMKIIAEDVQPVTRHRKAVPPNVAAAVAKALEKLPADRFESARAFADALGNGAFTSLKGMPTASVETGAGGSRRSLLAMGALAGFLALVAIWGWMRPTPVAAPSYQRVVLWHHGVGDFLAPGSDRVQSQVAIAPDGSSLVYSDSLGTTSQLMLKLRDRVDATPIAGTEGGMSPFYSPDGKWVAYFDAGGHVRKVPVSGGGSVPLADSANATYAIGDWLDDNTIIFVDQANGLRRVSGDGGPVSIARGPSSGIRIDPTTLAALPGSHAILLTGCPGNCASGSAIYAYDFRNDSTHLLVPNAAGAWYAPGGYLLYTAREGGLYAAEFDLGRLKVTSGAIPVVSSVAPSRFALSRSGAAVYAVGTRDLSESRLVWVARDGTTAPFAPDWLGAFEYPALAPDGRTLAVSIRGASTQLWIRRADGSRRQVTVGDEGTWRAAFAPDGRVYSFVTTVGMSKSAAVASGNDLYESPTDGSGPPRRTLHLEDGIWEAEYSQDGEWQVIRHDRPGSFGVILARRTRGDTALRTILDDGSFNSQIAVSPDARWLAFTSSISGTSEVYVGSFPDMRVRMLVSQGGGTEPRWAHSGRELFFKSGGRLVSVAVAPGATFVPGLPRPLFSVVGYASASNRPQYSVAPDDRHFLMIRLPDTGPVPEAVYVENFLADLKAKMKQGLKP